METARSAVVTEQIADLLAPILTDLGLELYDLEHAGGILKVMVDRTGGVDLEALAALTRNLSRALDHADPIPGRYTLEVTSPGLERPLRTPAHYIRAVGATVNLRTHPGGDGDRRVTGLLVAADDHAIVVRAAGNEGERRLRYDEIERARTVFEWVRAAKPGGPKAKKPRPAAAGAATAGDEEAGAS